MDLIEKWEKIKKIQENLEITIKEIKEDLEKQKFIRDQWNLKKKEWFKKNKNHFTLIY